MALSQNSFAAVQPTILLSPISENRGVTQRNAHPPSQDSLTVGSKQMSNGIVSGARQIRPLSVNEALQYSPLSSIVPFGPDVIPLPSVGLSAPTSAFLSPSKQQAARRHVELLDDEVARIGDRTDLVQKTVQDLKEYLENPDLTEFVFKGPAGIANADQKTDDNGIKGTFEADSTRLGPFASMLSDLIEVAHRYPTPSTPGNKSPNTTVAETLPPPVLPITPITPQNVARNNLPYYKNAQSTATVPSPPVSDTSKTYPMVIVPPLPPSSQHSDYITFPDIPSNNEFKHQPPRKEMREGMGAVVKTPTQIKDQRSIATEALGSLQELIQDILEAEDSLQPDTSGHRSEHADSFFLYNQSEDQNLPMTLVPAIQMKLESCLQRVILSGRFTEIPVDQLCRVQKLCEGGLMAAEAEDLRLEPGCNDNESPLWLRKIDVADSGLRCARTILRIMTGDREEKQIYSEELLQTAVNVVKNITDSCIVPIVESRPTGSTAEIFEAASSHKKNISQLMHAVGKALQLIASLVSVVDVAETTITGLEYFLTRLLFVENAHSEKESVVGIQKFESLRRNAMDLVAEISSRYPEQRTFLFDEILTSLQKLPVTRQSARQFKLSDGKNIQLVSALIMRLVQTSGMPSIFVSKGRKIPQSLGDDAEAKIVSDKEGQNNSYPDSTSINIPNDVKRLSDSSANSAQYVIHFFVKRAMTATKTGDEPYRHLLDIFYEDLIAVLGAPEWPASELLLRALLFKMVGIAEQEKGLAPAKSMAIEILGSMGSAISDLAANTRQAARTLENDDSELSTYLTQLVDEYLEGRLENKNLLGWAGPYRTVMEYFQLRGLKDLQEVSAQGYYLTQWAKVVSSSDHETLEDSEGQEEGYGPRDVALRLYELISAGGWNDTDGFDHVSDSQGRLAYALTVLSMGFCRAFDRVLKILLDSISSDQTTVRSRSLKSVTHMLEKDPALLERAPHVIRLIMRCASDSSSSVRDSALVLIGKCILLKPALEAEVCKPVLNCVTDSAVTVRKRSLRLLKDIYLRTSRKDIKMAIADGVYLCAQDQDEGVSDLAKQIFEDIWLSPHWIAANISEGSAQEKVALREQVSLIIETVKRSDSIMSALEATLRSVLRPNAKNTGANFNVSKAMVAIMFDAIIDVDELPGKPEQHYLLQALTIFARIEPKLFNPEQLQHLQPYIGNLASADDLLLLRPAVIILRYTLPTLSSVQSGFLSQVQNALFTSVSKLGKSELDEVASCLWTINGVLKNIERLTKLTASVLKNLYSLKDTRFEEAEQKSMRGAKQYIRIAGCFGKYCNFEDNALQFKSIPQWHDSASITGMIVSSIRPFTAMSQPISLRAIALDGIGSICQVWPRYFNQSDISEAFLTVFDEGNRELQNIVLLSFKHFFATQDRGNATKQDHANDPTSAMNEKLGGSMTASDNDGASSLIAQRFLKHIVKIALASQDAYALTATEVIASIMRQGLVHPKKCGPALVALETSQNEAIANLAFQEHRTLHQQHESMFEREYMRSVYAAFEYQRDIVNDASGALRQPYASKLRQMFEVIKTSNGKYQKKVLSSICSRIDFDPTALASIPSLSAHLVYARFLVENLAFFDYGRLDELQHVLLSMEKIVASTGAGITNYISTEILKIEMEHDAKTTSAVQEGEQQPHVMSKPEDVEPQRLEQLTIASMVLSMLWDARTFLRRQYGLNAVQQRRESKNKGSIKDLSKPPSKVAGITGDRFIESISKIMSALDSGEAKLNQCKELVDLLSVDNELKVAVDGDDDGDRLNTPSIDDELEGSLPASGGSRVAKRKSSVSVMGTPQKRKKKRPSLGKRTKSGKSVYSDQDSDY